LWDAVRKLQQELARLSQEVIKNQGELEKLRQERKVGE
jgi:hypothetical protein